MWDYDPPPCAPISICLCIVLIPYIDDVLVLFMGMNGGRREGKHVPYGMTTLPVLSVLYFKEGIGQTIVVSCDSLFPYGRSCLHLMRTLLEQVMDGWVGDHLAYERSLSFVCDTNGGVDELQHSLISCLKISKFLEGRTVIFLISPS